MAKEMKQKKGKHPGGRPRTSSPPPNESALLGEEMLKWFLEPSTTNEPRLLFQQWYSLQKGILRKDWKNLIVTPEFSPYYEKVKALLASRCLFAMKEGFGQRYLRLYDRDLMEAENDHAEFTAKLRKEEESKPTEIHIKVANEGLGIGLGLQAEALPVKSNQGSK